MLQVRELSPLRTAARLMVLLLRPLKESRRGKASDPDPDPVAMAAHSVGGKRMGVGSAACPYKRRSHNTDELVPQFYT